MILCPACHSHKIKKNGFTHYGKQNHKCKDCKRQFVRDNQHTEGEAKREIARRALGERPSLRGICRVVGVNLRRICGFAAETWATAPEDLGLYTESNLLRSSKVLKIIGLQLDDPDSYREVFRGQQEKQGLGLGRL